MRKTRKRGGGGLQMLPVKHNSVYPNLGQDTLRAKRELLKRNEESRQLNNVQEEIAKKQRELRKKRTKAEATLLEAISFNSALQEIHKLIESNKIVKDLLKGNEHHTVFFPTDDNLMDVGITSEKVKEDGNIEQFLKSYIVKGHHDLKVLKPGQPKKVVNLNGLPIMIEKHDVGKIIIKHKGKPLAVVHSTNDVNENTGEKPVNGSLNTIKDISSNTSSQNTEEKETSSQKTEEKENPLENVKDIGSDALNNLNNARETVSNTAQNFASKAEDTVKNGLSALKNLITGNNEPSTEMNKSGGSRRRNKKRKTKNHRSKKRPRKTRHRKRKRNTRKH